MKTSKYYMLSDLDALKIVNKIRMIVKQNWKDIEKKYGASEAEIEIMKMAFKPKI